MAGLKGRVKMWTRLRRNVSCSKDKLMGSPKFRPNPRPVLGEWACAFCGFQALKVRFRKRVEIKEKQEIILVCPECGTQEDIFPTDDEGWPGQKHGEDEHAEDLEINEENW